MGNFDQKVNKFIEIFWEQNGYNKVIQGLQNTLMIAIAGLIIGIIIGTIMPLSVYSQNIKHCRRC